MVKSRQRKLDERWGAETSANGGRFKLNRHLAGFHFSRRNPVEIEDMEKDVRLRIDDPPGSRQAGTLVSLENVGFAYGEGQTVLSGVTLGVEPGGRVGLLGAVGHLSSSRFAADQ